MRFIYDLYIKLLLIMMNMNLTHDSNQYDQEQKYDKPNNLSIENAQSSKSISSKKAQQNIQIPPQKSDSQQKKNKEAKMLQEKIREQSKTHVKLKKQYYDFFKNIIADPQNYVPQMPTEDQFRKHKIKYLKGNKFHQDLQSYDQSYIRVKNTQKQGTIVIYTVIIAMFQLEIALLNIDSKAKIQENKIGSGGFGSVRVQSQNKRMFAVKRQMFKEKQFNMIANKYEIDEAINQLAIYKICSLLKIGPAAETQIGFDLICYRDCIEFQIELCAKMKFKYEIISVDKNKFERQIKQCLLTLHYYGIIHKDIKPHNILFSITYNKYVLTDFGISHPVIQKIGYLTKTHHQGTQDYMSKQMRQILAGQTSFVHLYGNDVYSLSVVLNKQIYNKSIQTILKQFRNTKQKKTQYQYEYLKLKYYCIKPDSKMEEVQSYWKHMNDNRRQQLIAIVDKSIEYNKINSVYNYLSKSQEFKQCDLESLRIQSQSIKNIKIDPDNKQATELNLKNALRVYGYSQQVKDIIIRLKLEQKYKDTLQMINKILNQKRQVNHRDRFLGNYVNYIKKIKKQLYECQQKEDYEGMFSRYMIILQYGNQQEGREVIERLNNFNYKRKNEESIQQKIRVINKIRSKEKLKQFIQYMKISDEKREKILIEKNLYGDVAEIYIYIGKYETALQYLEKNLQRKIQFHGEKHPSVADSYNSIARIYHIMGKYKAALQQFNKSLNMKIYFHGQLHPYVADMYSSMANLYKQFGKYETALEYYTKSLNIWIFFNLQQHPYVQKIYNNIANVYNDLGKHEKALQYYTKNINLDIQLYGQPHPSVADRYNNIAILYKQMGRYETALQYLNKSLSMQKQFYGQQYPSISKTYNNLALVYLWMADCPKALDYFNMSLKMQISFYGQEHPNIADTYKNMASVYNSMGKYKQALQYYTKSLNMQKSFYGQQHPTIAEIYNNMGIIYDIMGQYETALQYYLDSLFLQIFFYQQKHPSVAVTYNNIGVVYYTMGYYELALQQLNSSLNINMSIHGQNHPSIAENYINKANVYKDMEEFETALKYYNKALNMLKLFHKQKHPTIARTYNNIGIVYEFMRKYEKAREYYNNSINMKILLYGQQDLSIADTYNNMAGLYNNTGNYEKALQYFTKSLNIKLLFYEKQHPSVRTIQERITAVTKNKRKIVLKLKQEEYRIRRKK